MKPYTSTKGEESQAKVHFWRLTFNHICGRGNERKTREYSYLLYERYSGKTNDLPREPAGKILMCRQCQLFLPDRVRTHYRSPA
jgi:hypothetical protein